MCPLYSRGVLVLTSTMFKPFVGDSIVNSVVQFLNLLNGSW